MISLMLVDDHAMLREGLRRKFEDFRDIKVVSEASTAEELLRALSEAPIDVVILDIKLPDGNGFALVKRIKGCQPSARVVVLTMHNHVRYALHALECGADGFVIKDAPFEELVKAIRAVRAGQTYVCSEISPQLISRFRKPQQGSSIDSLSPREFEVLTLLSSGLSLKEVGIRMEIGEKTVGTYRARLMEKLNLSNNADLVRFALESGLIE